MSGRRVRRTKHGSSDFRKRRSVVNNTYSQAVISQNKGANCNKRRLNINLNASPIKTQQQSRKQSHLHSVHTLPYHFVNSSLKSKAKTKSSKTKMKTKTKTKTKSKSKRNNEKLNKKRVSAPIILQSSTTPSISSTASGAITSNIDCILSASISSSNKVDIPSNYITNNPKKKQEFALNSPIKYTTPYNTPIGISLNNHNDMKIMKNMNEMIKEPRKSFRSRPRRYSKTRRLSTKLYDLMETVSTDENLHYSCFPDSDELNACKYSKEEESARRAKHDYHETLKKYGYIEIRKIAKSLQGIVIEAEYIDKTSKGWDSVIIKITDKKLHAAKISNKHGKSLRVEEDIMKEKRLLMYLTANNPPSSLVEFLGFFSDEYNYFLVMENGGEDFFDWIVKCHEWIREGKVSMKQWNLYIRDLMVQVLELLHWLHRKMNVCHLDISLENMLIKNNKYKSDGNGGIRLSRKMQVKFCDFGLAEFFKDNNNNEISPKNRNNDRFLCNKYVGKTHYKAPKVYGKKETFDARKADIWSLGVSFFMIMIGAPPYKLPLSSDDHFPYIQKRNVVGILKRWGREHYINGHVEELMNMMMEIDEDKRANIDDLIQHEWFQNANFGNKNQKNKKNKNGSNYRRKSSKNTRMIDNNARMLAKMSENTKLNQNNVFEHLVTQQDQQRLFRYKKRRLTNNL